MLERIAADSTRTDQERAEAFYNLGNAQFKQENTRKRSKATRTPCG